MDTVRTLLTRLGEFMATPAAFGVLLAFFCLWLTFDRASLDWHAVATCATLAMTLLILTLRHFKQKSTSCFAPLAKQKMS